MTGEAATKPVAFRITLEYVDLADAYDMARRQGQGMVKEVFEFHADDPDYVFTVHDDSAWSGVFDAASGAGVNHLEEHESCKDGGCFTRTSYELFSEDQIAGGPKMFVSQGRWIADDDLPDGWRRGQLGGWGYPSESEEVALTGTVMPSVVTEAVAT